MHFLAIWQLRYLLTFREQEREAVQNILLLFQLQCTWSLLSKNNKNKNKKTYFQEYQKYKLNCDTYALKPVYNMISSMLREACLRWI